MVSESLLNGLEIIYEALEKVQMKRDRLKAVYSRKMSYAENRRRDLDFEVGDKVLRIPPMKEVLNPKVHDII